MFYELISSVLGLPDSLGTFGVMLTGIGALFVFIVLLLFFLEFVFSFRKFMR